MSDCDSCAKDPSSELPSEHRLNVYARQEMLMLFEEEFLNQRQQNQDQNIAQIRAAKTRRLDLILQQEANPLFTSSLATKVGKTVREKVLQQLPSYREPPPLNMTTVSLPESPQSVPFEPEKRFEEADMTHDQILNIKFTQEQRVFDSHSELVISDEASQVNTKSKRESSFDDESVQQPSNRSRQALSVKSYAADDVVLPPAATAKSPPQFEDNDDQSEKSEGQKMNEIKVISTLSRNLNHNSRNETKFSPLHTTVLVDQTLCFDTSQTEICQTQVQLNADQDKPQTPKNLQKSPSGTSEFETYTETASSFSGEEDQVEGKPTLIKAKLQQRKSVFLSAIRGGMLSGDIENDQLYEKYPNFKAMAFLDGLRAFAVPFFITDAGLKYAYYSTSRFISVQVQQLFLTLLLIRPIFIVLYHLFRLCSELQYYLFTFCLQQRQDVNRSNKIACGLIELFLQSLTLPVCMFTGFFRQISFGRKKSQYVLMGLCQELLLHQVPLSMVIRYNNEALGQETTSLQRWLKALLIVHSTFVALELCCLKSYVSSGIDLDQRIKAPEALRIKFSLTYFTIGVGLMAISVSVCLNAFEKQGCSQGFYSQEGSPECYDCTFSLGEQCLSCSNSLTCTSCDQTSYLDTGTAQCLGCRTKFASCERCDADSCYQCAEGFYLDGKQCKRCSDIQGCTFCSHDRGCEVCEAGYFPVKKQCQSCSQALFGCRECTNEQTCTQCSSDFLYVSRETKRCVCDTTNMSNMHIAINGACICEPGYYLTKHGCKTCQDLIPGCARCYTSQANSMIPLYTEASLSLSQKQFYVDCSECDYGRYRVRPNYLEEIEPQCPTCATKIDGCAECGSTGQKCTKCLNTHVFTSSQSSMPCVPCGQYMKGCVWCRSSSDCVQYSL